MGRQMLSGAEVCRRTGWRPMYLSRRLRGETPFDVDDLEQLAALLNVTVFDFFPDGRGTSNPVYSPLVTIRGLHRSNGFVEQSTNVAA